MARRKGMTYRVHDFKYLTIGIDPYPPGPQAFAYIKWPRRWPQSVRVHRLALTLPHVSFAWALRLRKVGGLKLFGLCSRFYHRVGR